MAERVSAIPTCKHLIGSHFLSFSDFTPHFTPHNFLSIVAFKWHGNFVSGVTDAVLQPSFGFRHGGGGYKIQVCGSRTAVLRWVGRGFRA